MKASTFWKWICRQIRRRRILRKMTKTNRRQRARRETVYGEVYDPTSDKEPLPEPPQKTPQQLESLRKKIQRTAFLKELDEKRLTAALSHMTLKEVKAGDTIFKQGEPGDTFYIVEEGEFDVYQKDDDGAEGLGDETGSYDADSPCIGELALLYRDERMTTVKAATDGKLWQLDRPLYTRVVVRMAYERRQRHMEYLEAVPMLETVENYERVRLCDAIEQRKYKEGEKIMKEGDKADGIFFVEGGEVELETKSGEKKTLKEGSHFGELALLSKGKRSETCTAKTDCEVAFLDTEAFERLLGKLKTLLQRKPDVFKKVCKEALGTENPDENQIR